MRFAGDLLIEGAPLTEQGLERQRWNEQQKVPLGIQLNPDDLEVTPELTPGGYQGPGIDLLRDQYIRNDPRSGIAMAIGNPAVVVGNQIRMDMMNRPFESGTLQDAYLKGVPGVPKPVTPDVIKRTPAPDLWL